MTEPPAKEITEDQKQRARNVLGTMPIARLMGMNLVDLRPGEAEISVDMHDNLRQPHGLLHGGVTATLIDTAMAFAIRTRLDDTDKTATIDLTIHYVRPHISGKITCRARIVRAGRRIFTVSADVVNDDNKLIATAVSAYTRI